MQHFHLEVTTSPQTEKTSGSASPRQGPRTTPPLLPMMQQHLSPNSPDSKTMRKTQKSTVIATVTSTITSPMQHPKKKHTNNAKHATGVNSVFLARSPLRSISPFTAQRMVGGAHNKMLQQQRQSQHHPLPMSTTSLLGHTGASQELQQQQLSKLRVHIPAHVMRQNANLTPTKLNNGHSQAHQAKQLLPKLPSPSTPRPNTRVFSGQDEDEAENKQTGAADAALPAERLTEDISGTVQSRHSRAVADSSLADDIFALDDLLDRKYTSAMNEECAVATGPTLNSAVEARGSSVPLQQHAGTRNAASDGNDVAVTCAGCIALQSTITIIENELINVREDNKEYQEHYRSIQEEGARLYAVYQSKCNRLKYTNSRQETLEAAIYTLKQENENLVEEYDSIYNAYHTFVGNYKKMDSQLKRAKKSNAALQKRLKQQQQLSTSGQKQEQSTVAVETLKQQNKELMARLRVLESQLCQNSGSGSVNDSQCTGTVQRSLEMDLNSRNEELKNVRKDFEELKKQVSEGAAVGFEELDKSKEQTSGMISSAWRTHLESARISNSLLRTELSSTKKQLIQLQPLAQQAEMNATKVRKLEDHIARLEDMAQKSAELNNVQTSTHVFVENKTKASGDIDVEGVQNELEKTHERMDQAEAQVSILKKKNSDLENDLVLLHKRHEEAIVELQRKFQHDAYKRRYEQVLASNRILREAVQRGANMMSRFTETDTLQTEIVTELKVQCHSVNQLKIEASSSCAVVEKRTKYLEDEISRLSAKVSQCSCSKMRERVKNLESQVSKTVVQSVIDSILSNVVSVVDKRHEMRSASHMHSVLRDADARLRTAEADVAAMRNEKIELAEFIEVERVANRELTIELEKRVSDLTKQLNESRSEAVRLSTQVAALSESLSSADETKAALANMERDVNNLKQQLQDSETALENEHGLTTSLKQSAAASEMKCSKATTQIESMTQELMEMRDAFTAETHRAQRSETSLYATQDELRTAREAAAAQRTECGFLRDNMVAVEQALKASRTRIGQLEHQIQSLDRNHTKDQWNQLQVKLQQTEAAYACTASKAEKGMSDLKARLNAVSTAKVQAEERVEKLQSELMLVLQEKSMQNMNEKVIHDLRTPTEMRQIDNTDSTATQEAASLRHKLKAELNRSQQLRQFLLQYKEKEAEKMDLLGKTLCSAEERSLKSEALLEAVHGVIHSHASSGATSRPSALISDLMKLFQQ